KKRRSSMSSAVSAQPIGSSLAHALATREVRIYSQSMLFYWWPVWAVGYLMAAITYVAGRKVDFVLQNGDQLPIGAYFHTTGNLGVIFLFTLLLVIVMTHFVVRGVASLTVIVTAIAVTLFLAYMGWWDAILEWVWGLRAFMNLSFYLILSTALFVLWLSAVFI